MTGPYETERDTLAAPLAVDIRNMPATLHLGAHREIAIGHLRQACTDAGVDLGAFDERVLAWLSGWGPSTVQVVIGLISRAHVAGILRDSSTVARARAMATSWAADRTAFPDGAAPILEEIADLLGGDR